MPYYLLYVAYVCTAPHLSDPQPSARLADDLPVIACGLLGRILPPLPELQPLRHALTERLSAASRQPANYGLLEWCAIMDGLQALDPHRLTADMPARFVQRLLKAELTVGGPYAETGQPPDALTNAYIAQCLSWLAQPLPKLERFLLRQHPGLADYERADWPVYMYLVQPAGSQPAPGRQVVADIAQALAAQLNYRTFYDGQPGSRSQSQSITKAAIDTGPPIATAIYAASRQRLQDELTGPLWAITSHTLQAIISSDHHAMRHEISQLAWYYATALVPPAPEASSAGQQAQRRLCEIAGVANLFAWMAYSVYHDFMDGTGRPDMVGTANYSLRAMMACYRDILPPQSGYWRFVERCLTTADHAHCRETKDFRWPVSGDYLHISHLPDYAGRTLLADRALFHILGPMAVLAGSGVAIGSPQWEAVLQGWRHYLIARQLNDDLHDWRQDLQAGQATYVAVELLRYLNLPPGSYRLSQLLPAGRDQFWQAVLPMVCATGLEHVRAARQGIAAGPPLQPNNEIERLFEYTEGALQAASAQRQQALQLVKAMQGRP